MAEPERLRGVGAGGVPMQVSVFRDKSAARCFGVLGIVGGSCTFLAGVTIVIIKASKGREKDEVLSYASMILIGVVIAALGVALSATAKGKSDQDAHKESGEASDPALENEAPPPIDDGPPPKTRSNASSNGTRSASRQSKNEGEGTEGGGGGGGGGNRKKKSTRKAGSSNTTTPKKKGTKKKTASNSSSKASIQLLEKTSSA